MGLSRLLKECQDCPYQDICTTKKVEAYAYLPEPIRFDYLASNKLARVLSVNTESPMGITVSSRPINERTERLVEEMIKKMQQNFNKSFLIRL